MTNTPNSLTSLTSQTSKRKTECSQRTKGIMTEVIFNWTIENLTHKCQNMKIGKNLISNIFSAKDDKVNQWQLKCYPAGNKEEEVGFLSIFLNKMNPPNDELTAIVKWSVLNVDEGIFIRSENISSSVTFSKSIKSWGYAKFLAHKDLLGKNSKYLKEDAITLQCKITYEDENIPFKSKVPRLETPACRIFHDFGDLFKSGRMSDITFLVGRQQFKAHKIVMSARSSVFNGMFEIDGRVSPLASLKIENCEPEVFEAMLRFIYTDQMEETEEMAKKLLAVAQKYQLQLLKLKCEEVLSQSISMDNCAEMLLLAHIHGATLLKKDAMDFIRRNSADVIKTAGWKTLRQTRPQLGLEIFDFISS